MSARRAFAAIAALPDEEIEIDRAALLIAAEEYPELELERYLGQLDRIATRVLDRLFPDAGPRETIARINDVLFQEDGFHGNVGEYYDPRNSYLNDVLDRRTGIPITLSTVYIEVARRIGFALDGVGFPGHFLVQHSLGEEPLLIDPFAAGRILTPEDCQARLDRTYGRRVKLEPDFLRASSRRRILFRLLNNLKSIYVRRHDSRRALAAVERMLLLIPDAHQELRDRGILLSQTGRPMEALAELARYRRLLPAAEDGERIDNLIERLRLHVSRLN